MHFQYRYLSLPVIAKLRPKLQTANSFRLQLTPCLVFTIDSEFRGYRVVFGVQEFLP